MALTFTTLVWGVSAVFVRSFSLAAGPLDALIIRTAAVAMLFALVLAVTTGFHVDRRDWPRLLFLCLVGVGGYYAFSVFGFAYAPAGIGMLIMSTQPLLIALLASLAGTEKLTGMTITGLFVSFGGSALLVAGDNTGSTATSAAALAFGCLLIFLAGVVWSLFVVFGKPLIVRYGALKITGLGSMVIAPPILMLTSVQPLGAAPLETIARLDAHAWMSLAFLTTVSATLSLVSWNYAAGILRPSLMGAALYVVPVLAVFSGWALLNEPVTTHIVLSAAVILAGVAIAQIKTRSSAIPQG